MWTPTRHPKRAFASLQALPTNSMRRSFGMAALAIRPAFVADGAVVQDLMQSDIKEMRGKLAERGSWFRTIAAADHRKLEWRTVLDFPNEALACEARGADLVVIGRTTAPGDSYSVLDPGGAVLKIGRPTLVVPDGVTALRVGPCRDRLEGFARSAPCGAGCAAVPARGEPCHRRRNLRIRPGIRRAGTHRRRRPLSVAAPHQRRPSGRLHQEGSGAAQLIRLAQDEGADLIVAGAYGHSRLGEWMFGGMTRDLLAKSPTCCLMSH
jgi:Universal stress protein family